MKAAVAADLLRDLLSTRALEDRIRGGVLLSGGLWREEIPAIADLANHASRITIPTLMLNGRYDSQQKPLFRLLGTPAADKRHVVYETGHGPLPRKEMIGDTLDWLDRYLGPVN